MISSCLAMRRVLWQSGPLGGHSISRSEVAMSSFFILMYGTLDFMVNMEERHFMVYCNQRIRLKNLAHFFTSMNSYLKLPFRKQVKMDTLSMEDFLKIQGLTMKGHQLQPGSFLSCKIGTYNGLSVPQHNLMSTMKQKTASKIAWPSSTVHTTAKILPFSI